MKLPRKLKKGCRTLHGNPCTKWQRRGQQHLVRIFENISKAACTAAVGMDVLRQAFERINPVQLPPNGIVPPPPQVMMVGESTGETVLHRSQLNRLKHVVMVDPMDGARTTMSQMNFSDIFEKIISKTIKTEE